MKSIRKVHPLKELVGATRIRRKFLFLPRRFLTGDSIETRWLCWADILEQVSAYREYMDAMPVGVGYDWFEVGFASP